MSRSTPSLPRELDAQQAQSLIDAAGDIALVLDGQGRILDVRARDAALHAVALNEWRGKSWIDTVNSDSRAKVESMLRDALAGEVVSARQINHPAASGPDLPVLYTAALVVGAGRTRSSERVVAIGRDLRDTVLLQRRLVDAQQSMERDYWRFREAETRYRSLFQASAEAVLIVDGANLRILEANPAAQALLAAGRAKPAKLVGTAIAVLFDAEAAEPLAAALAAARSVGKHERLTARLAPSGLALGVSITSFRQDQSSFLLVRLAALAVPEPRRHRGNGKAVSASDPDVAGESLAAAFVRDAADAMAFTDGQGRITAANRAFVRLAQLSSEDQARGEPLDRWLGRTGVELPVLLANLREGGQAGLFTTVLRGEQGVTSEVEIAASAFEAAGAPAFAFSVRDIGRRLAAGEPSTSKTPASVQQLTELVGRVPLRQIVAESSDLIERLAIETALTMTRDNRALAAQLLGLSRQSLYVKLRRFGLGGLGEDSNDA